MKLQFVTQSEMRFVQNSIIVSIVNCHNGKFHVLAWIGDKNDNLPDLCQSEVEEFYGGSDPTYWYHKAFSVSVENVFEEVAKVKEMVVQQSAAYDLWSDTEYLIWTEVVLPKNYSVPSPSLDYYECMIRVMESDGSLEDMQFIKHVLDASRYTPPPANATTRRDRVRSEVNRVRKFKSFSSLHAFHEEGSVYDNDPEDPEPESDKIVQFQFAPGDIDRALTDWFRCEPLEIAGYPD